RSSLKPPWRAECAGRPGGRRVRAAQACVKLGGACGQSGPPSPPGGVCTTLVPTALARNRNERLSRVSPYFRTSPGGWCSVPTKPAYTAMPVDARGAEEGHGVPGTRPSRWNEMSPYRLPGHGAASLLETLSKGRVNHPKVVQE